MNIRFLAAVGTVMCLVAAQFEAAAQKKDFSYNFYGQVRADLFYNSRSNSETVDGLFYMYPHDQKLDIYGNDLNAKPDGSLYTMYSRLGVNVTGPKLGEKISTAGCLEIDFRGGGTNYNMVRIRQAYFTLGFGQSQLLVGQTWHPFYGDVAPDILNLNMGAPYQPFSRAPQLRYRYAEKGFRLTTTLLWQSQYLSVGPASNETGETSSAKSQNFIKNSCVPEVALNLDYISKEGKWLAGVGVDMTSIVPRTQAEYGGAVRKVDERITSVSGEAHFRFASGSWLVAGKTVLGSNFTQASGVGGYAITGYDQITGEQEYEPIKVSSTWLNVAYGKKWRPALFFGYLKALNIEDFSSIIGTGVGDGLQQLVTASAEIAYKPAAHWKFGAEYMLCNAWYGTNIGVVETHTIMNHRVVVTAIFQF